MKTLGVCEMSVDRDDTEGGFSCGGAVTASKKLKKADGRSGEEKKKLQQQRQQQRGDVHSPPRVPNSLLHIPPSRRPKRAERLRPDKWKAAFDLEGRPVGFHKLLKIIRKGGVDHSVRAEVWEFLLGCYELGTTSAYRELVRQARRERYNELLAQCRKMHSSVGTGSLAYTVGSKLMDVRVASNDEEDDVPVVERASPVKKQSKSDGGAWTPREAGDQACEERHSAGCENLNLIARELSKRERTSAEELKLQEPLPGEVDSLEATPRQKPGARGLVKKRTSMGDDPKFGDAIQRSLIVEVPSNGEVSSLRDMDVEGQDNEQRSTPEDSSFVKSVDLDFLPSPRLPGDAERVTDWLWTLHRIVVDVVRTDKHLEFYNEGKNSARMSDILAVYAWIDPATGYCQGMSDLLSPFIVLFDCDADAFWCFESLLKRVRENFQMEGPVRVMKQLEALPKILNVTDADMLRHLVLVGADNFLFAFRMLLVLFRRELSFPEALYMWEMMWAADFHEAIAWSFEYQCLEALRLPLLSSPARVFPLEEEEVCKAPSPEPASTPPEPTSTSPPRLPTASESLTFVHALRCRALAKKRSFCGLRPGRLWQFPPRRRWQATNSGLSDPDGDQDISVFCVAAIMEQNRTMLLEKLQSMDDAIKIFNNVELQFKVHTCVNNAVKLRKQYKSQSSKRVVLERRSLARQPWSL